MKFTETSALLVPQPMALETGFERFADGVLHVACRTDMRACTGEMFEWWFQFRPDTQKYIWWHPVDHVFSDWIECREGTHVGSIHVVEEYFTGLPSQKLAIQFREATEFFTEPEYAGARRQKHISAAVCARIGVTHEPVRDAQARIVGGRLLHIGRDTDWGLVLRSHFYLGQDLPAIGKTPADIEQIFSDDFGRALLQHCYNEFTFLSRFLPSLFIAENRDSKEIALPW